MRIEEFPSQLLTEPPEGARREAVVVGDPQVQIALLTMTLDPITPLPGRTVDAWATGFDKSGWSIWKEKD